MNKTKQDWVITTKGKVVRRDKAKKTDVIEDKVGEYDNCFPDKESAYFTRDEIVDQNPSAFLDDEPIPEMPVDIPHGKLVTQDEFQEMMRKEVMKRINIFWRKWALLPPLDQCNLFYKMFAYAFSKAPTAKATDADADKRKADSKRKEAAERIAQGLPPVEDTNFEE